MSGRSPLQIFKDTFGKNISAADFASLPVESALPYRIQAALEKLSAATASAEVVTQPEVAKEDIVLKRLPVARAALDYLKLLPPPVEPVVVPAAAAASPKGKGRGRSASSAAVPSKEVSLQQSVVPSTAPDWAAISRAAKCVIGHDITENNLVAVASQFKTAEAELRKRMRDEKIDPDASKRQGPRRNIIPPATLEEEVAAPSPAKSAKRVRVEGAGSDNAQASAALLVDSADPTPSADVVHLAKEEEVDDDREPGAVVDLVGEYNMPAATAMKQKLTRTAPIVAFTNVKTLGRLRALTPLEKKMVVLLHGMIEALGAEYANQGNQLNELFSQLRKSYTEVRDLHDRICAPAAAPDAPVLGDPTHYRDLLAPVLAAVVESERLFNLPGEDYQRELDEYLLHPIAHACLSLINAIEGFQTGPCRVITEKEIEERAKAREALRQKMDEKRRHDAEREQAKIEAHQRKEAELRLAKQKREEESRQLKNQLRGSHFDAKELVEDTLLQGAPRLADVHYDPAIEDPAVYSTILECWAAITSVPRALQLSQCPLSLFSSAVLTGTTDNVILEEVFRSLLDVCLKYNGAPSPAVAGPGRINTRGKSWFDAVVEYVTVTSGNKKKRPPPKKQLASSDSDSSESDSSDSDSSDSDSSASDSSSSPSSSSSSDSASNKSAAAAAPPVVEEAPAAPIEGTFEHTVAQTVRAIAELRAMAAWANLEIQDRLVLLQYMVRGALESKKVVDEAEKVSREHEAAIAAHDKKRREIIDEAEKELKAAVRKPKAAGGSPVMQEPPAPADPQEIAARKAKIVASAEAAENDAFAALVQRETADLGVRIRPIGQDRYRRTYWRLPFEKQILVETTAETDPNIPIEAPPPEEAKKSLVDEDVEVKPKGRRGAATQQKPTPVVEEAKLPTQRVFGFISAERLPAFIQTLDVRGKREARLKAALEPCVGYFKSAVALPVESGRMTRSRAAAQGYQNKLKLDF